MHMEASASPDERKLRIDADLLIPGHGVALENATLIAIETKIAWVGPTQDIPARFRPLDAIRTPVLMPGMWDCHAHFLGATSYDASKLFKVKPALAGARAARDLSSTLDAGFTSIREPGGYGIDLTPAVEDGWLKGPHIYSAASIISMTAGHDDLRDDPIEYNKANSLRGGPFYVADGRDECLVAVRMQVRRGASLIKIATTGGVGSDDSVDNSQFSLQEIKVMVDEAARNGLIVAAHAHGAAGIKTAILGGCKTIEHGSLADDECIELMKKHGTILVPTRSVQDYGSKHPELFSKQGYEKVKRINEESKKSYAKAIKAGVRIALGTDIAISSPDISFRHGTNAREFVLAVEAGMTPLQAIEAGTAAAPATLGPKAPLSGQLREGYDADFISLSESPLDDIKVLTDTTKITQVWKGGQAMKDTLKS